MTFPELFAPIAAAAVINVFLFAGAWRATQIEKREGKPPWYLEAGFVGYCCAGLLFVYLTRGERIGSYSGVFGAAFFAQGMAAVIVHSILTAFVFKRGAPWSERAFPIVAAVFLTGMVFAGAIL